MTDMVTLIDRAAKDADFLSELVTAEQRTLAAKPASAQPEIAEILRARIAHLFTGKQ